MTRGKQKLGRKRLCLQMELLEDRRLLAVDPFTIVQLPDTQTLAESSPATFAAQTQWVADHVDSDNIVFLSHVGDVVDDSSSVSQWQVASGAFETLDGDPAVYPDGRLPYSVAIGNHDYDDDNSHNGSTQFTKFFGESRYDGKSWYGGTSVNELNHFQIFYADDQPLLHLTVEWEPRDSAITWAQGILDSYSDLPTILTTHAYIDQTGGHSTQQMTSDGRSGSDVFADLVSPNSQIFMVLGGHFGTQQHQVSLNSGGSEVIEILANYQSRAAGDDGYMRLIEFDPLANLVNFTTYSPTLDQFETDAESQYSIGLDLQQRFDLADAPRARLTQPTDNSPGDFDPLANSTTVNTAQATLEVSLLDFSPGIDDATVTSSTLTLKKDGQLLVAGTDYTFDYEAITDQIQLAPIVGAFDSGSYEVTLNSGAAKIADQNGNELAATIFGVTVDTTIPDPPESLYFALNSTATLPNGITVENEDVIYFDGDSFSLVFDGSDVGLASFGLDALDLISENELLFSLTAAGNLPGISGTVDDSDVVRFIATELGPTTSGTFELYFDGSDVGLTSSGEDVDSIDLLDDGRLLISTRSTFNVGSVAGGDEDVIAFTPTSLGDQTAGSWEMFFDGSAAGLADEDVNSFSVYPNGDIYLSVDGSFTLLDSTIRDDDVFTFRPTSLGDNTSGVIVTTLFLDGSLYGLSPHDLMALHVPRPVPLSGNSTPNANADAISLVEGGSATQLIGGAVSVLSNDTDADLPDDTLTVTTTPLSGPSFGSLVLNADGTFSYTHDGSENHSDSFVYEARDVAGASDTAVVSIDITPVNDNPPVAVGESIVVSQGATATELVGGSDNLLDNDSDEDLPNDSLTVNTLAISPPSNGTLTLNANGTFSYTHDGGVSVTDSFTYQVTDAVGAADTAVVTIDITAANAPPTASDGLVATPEDVGYTFTTSDFHFADSDGDDFVQIRITQLEAAGSLRLLGSDVVLGQTIAATDIAAGNLQYLPVANANGLSHDMFRFEVHDGNQFSADDYAMTIDVDAVNDPPTLAGLPDISIFQDGSDSIDLNSFYSDIETPAAGATFSVLSSFVGVSASIDPVTNQLAIDADPGFIGEGDITIEVTDSGDGVSVALSDTDTFHVTVSPVGSEPLLLFGLDRTATVGGVSAENEDILVYDGANFSLLFDGSDVGIGGGKLDAFALLSPDEILLSFSSPLSIPGIVDTVDDSDLVRFTGSQFGESTQGTFDLYFDGSDVGLDASSNDIDAVEVLPDGRLLISITGSDSVGGISVRDDDLIEFTPSSLGETTSGSWAMFFDGSDVNLSAEDLHGVSMDSNGDLYFNVQNDFAVGGVSGDDEDVFVFVPATLGTSTSGTFLSSLYFDGSSFGISAAELSGIDLVSAESLPPLGASSAQASAQTSLQAPTALWQPTTSIATSAADEFAAEPVSSQAKPSAILAPDVDRAMRTFQLPGSKDRLANDDADITQAGREMNEEIALLADSVSRLRGLR